MLIAKIKDLFFNRRNKVEVESLDGDVNVNGNVKANNINNVAVVTNIKQISETILSSLKAGDVVLKQDSSGYHAYKVSFKKDRTGICLTYTDASLIETVSYDFVDGHWVYNSTDMTNVSDSVKIWTVSEWDSIPNFLHDNEENIKTGDLIYFSEYSNEGSIVNKSNSSCIIKLISYDTIVTNSYLKTENNWFLDDSFESKISPLYLHRVYFSDDSEYIDLVDNDNSEITSLNNFLQHFNKRISCKYESVINKPEILSCDVDSYQNLTFCYCLINTSQMKSDLETYTLGTEGAISDTVTPL